MIEYLLVFLAGMISTISPCILPVIPVIFATSFGRVSGSFLVVLGMVVSFGVFGFIFGFISSFPILRFFSLLILLLYSLYLMFGFKFNPSDSAPMFVIIGKISSKMHGRIFKLAESSLYPIVLGMSLGFVWAPCIGPILGAVLTLISLKANPFEGMALMVVYAIGIGTMIAFLMIAGRTSSRKFSDSERINRAFGIIMFVFIVMVITGIFDSFTVIFADKLGFFEEFVAGFLFG